MHTLLVRVVVDDVAVWQSSVEQCAHGITMAALALLLKLIN